jgi:hypothetical protein
LPSAKASIARPAAKAKDLVDGEGNGCRRAEQLDELDQV